MFDPSRRQQQGFVPKSQAAKPENEPTPPSSVQNAPETAQEAPGKTDFKDPIREHAEMKAESERRMAALNRAKNPQEDAVAKLNESMAGGGSKALEDEDAFSDEDLRIAEEMIFKGYAEKTVPMQNLKNRTLTVCSTSAEDISVIDAIVFEYVKKHTKDDGTVDLGNNSVQAFKNSLHLALSFKGFNDKDVCDTPINHLTTLKNAVSRYSELESQGELEKASNLFKNMRDSLLVRAARIKKFPTPLIDFIGEEKYKFDTKALQVMSTKGIIPKS